MVRDCVGGFGHQAIIALNPNEPQPGPRLYSDEQDSRFQDLRTKLEHGWIEQLVEAAGVSMHDLPMLWDIDFMFGEPGANGPNYILCEVNVSSVSPFPPSAIGPLVIAVLLA